LCTDLARKRPQFRDRGTRDFIPTSSAICKFVLPEAFSKIILARLTSPANYGYFDTNWSPWHRLTARIGANLTGTSGSVLIITPNAPSGPLNSTYYQPFGGLDYRFAKGWTGKAYWGYYGYHEDASGVPQDLFVPRNFQSNLVTLSLRYAF